jgi:chorismate mutase
MVKPAEILKPFRDRIDALDDKIVDLLIERYDVVREVAKVKGDHNIPTVAEERIKEVINRVGDRAGEKNEDIVCEIYALMIAIAHDVEDEVNGRGNAFSDD